MAVFFGTHAMKIDGKGRVSMPAPFRDALQKAGSPDAVLMPTEGAHVIEGCDRGFVEALVNRAYSDEPMEDAERQQILGMLGEMVTLSFDPEKTFRASAAAPLGDTNTFTLSEDGEAAKTLVVTRAGDQLTIEEAKLPTP